MQWAKNVLSFFCTKGSKKFFVFNIRGLGKIEFGTENAFLFGFKEGVIDSQFNREDRMHKPILVTFILFGLILYGLIIFAEDIFGQEVYKSVDEKGTVNFSDSPNSPVVTTKKGAVKQDGAEVLKKNEKAKKGTLSDSEIEAALLKRPTWRGSTSSSGGGSSGTIRRGRS